MVVVVVHVVVSLVNPNDLLVTICMHIVMRFNPYCTKLYKPHWCTTYHQLRATRALSLFKDVLLRTRRVLSLYILYRYSVLLALSGTSLNSDNDHNALLTLNWQYIYAYGKERVNPQSTKPCKPCWITTHLHVYGSDCFIGLVSVNVCSKPL